MTNNPWDLKPHLASKFSILVFSVSSDSGVNLLNSGAIKVADLIAEEGNPELKLRVFVQGGGCLFFSYFGRQVPAFYLPLLTEVTFPIFVQVIAQRLS